MCIELAAAQQLQHKNYHIAPLSWQHINLPASPPGSMNVRHRKGLFGRSDRPHPAPAARSFGLPLRRGSIGYFRSMILVLIHWTGKPLFLQGLQSVS
jgi:hypothetical protein